MCIRDRYEVVGELPKLVEQFNFIDLKCVGIFNGIKTRMGCACSKGNKTSVKSPVSRRIHAENNKPLRFGAAFSEDMLYDEDEAFLSSRAFNRKVKVWNSMCSSPNSNQTLSMEERLSRYYAENSTEFLKQLRKGPPPKYRWTAWKTCLLYTSDAADE
eukprot:TRINITY_DN11693_c0_g2_i1.p1 TRINITY_DN11693_c0_g2~~TRINITY_DN11693_c0_g2_i1.p1  ORF type:complete len:158 (+),score=14.55 TRINITY_DN11693_c0_g2_i1:73-546(+)